MNSIRISAVLAVAIGLGAVAGLWLGPLHPERKASLATFTAELPPAVNPGAPLIDTTTVLPPQKTLDKTADADPFKVIRLTYPPHPAFHPPTLTPLAGDPLPQPLIAPTPSAKASSNFAGTGNATSNPSTERAGMGMRSLGMPESPPPEAPHPEAWAQYAMAAPANPARHPVIAIIIDDLGVASARIDAALALPAPMTMAVLPYARDAAAIARKARARGHEVLVHLPMEADNGEDPGPQALLNALTPAEFTARLHWNLAQFEGYVGVNNHMGSRLTQNAGAMAVLMQEMRRRGLLFVDSRTGPGTLAAVTGRAMGVMALERDVFLDNVITPGNIRDQLSKTEAAARRNGYAIAIGHPHAVTLAVLTEWASDLEERGFMLMPLSALSRMRTGANRSASLPPGGG